MTAFLAHAWENKANRVAYYLLLTAASSVVLALLQVIGVIA